MATNGEIPMGDTEMSECDGGEVVTMMDVLKEQQEFEDDANAVLGGSDDKECTYSKGYIKRQAIYACMTCCPESKENPSKRAGFCLACSLTCHENHDLVELYTKRNFRCDCGNPKFKSSCQFTPNKPDLNDENIYNQNFVGLYCICNKPYGEQENALDDEMIQCVICEDWWHAAHLEAVVPAHDQFSEMVCKLCMANNDFLHSYIDLSVNVESGNVDVVNTNGVDSTLPNEKLTNGSIADDKPLNTSVADETMVDDKITDVELKKKNQEQMASNDMEPNTTEDAPVINNDNHASSSEKETTVPNNAENDVSEPNKTVKTDQEICNDMETSSTEAPVTEDEAISNNDDEARSSENKSAIPNNAEKDTSEIQKTVETDQEMSSTDVIMETSEDKVDKKTSEDVNESFVDKIGSESTEDKLEETNETPAEEKITGEEKVNQDGAEQPTTTLETKSIKCKENDDSSNQPISDTINIELPAETETASKFENKEQGKAVSEDSLITENERTNDTHSEKTDHPKSTETAEDEKIIEISNTNENIEVETSTAMQEDIGKVDKAVDSSKESEGLNNIKNDESVPETVSIEKRKMPSDDAEESSAKKPKIHRKECIRPKDVKKVYKGATFWPSNFRQKLCTCNECISMYKDLSVLFLIDMEDTVIAYETLGKERTAGKPNQYEKGIEALCSLGRIQQIDALTEYNKMRDKLLTFLQSFKESKEVVTENDIKTFFAGMKKPVKRNDGVYFCG